MSNISYRVVDDNGRQTISIFDHSTGDNIVASAEHPNFDAILELARSIALEGVGDIEELFELSDIESSLRSRFERISERLTVRNGNAELDGVALENEAADAMIRALNEDDDDALYAIANFLEKLYGGSHPSDTGNPDRTAVTDFVREQLWRWLKAEEFSITDAGDIVGYKSVEKQADGTYLSIHSGRAFVNDEEKTGRIPQQDDDVVTMPRSEVTADPNKHCSHGLHVGTWKYAKSFSGDTVVKVVVNPRDVVSIPRDSNGEKLRTCRYQVVGVTTSKDDSLLWQDEFKVKELTVEEEPATVATAIPDGYFNSPW